MKKSKSKSKSLINVASKTVKQSKSLQNFKLNPEPILKENKDKKLDNENKNNEIK